MGLVRKNRIEDYWARDPAIATPFFKETMPIWLFQLISRMFHVSDRRDEKQRGEDGYDPWQKIRPVLDRLNSAWKRHYVPSRNISIDESMIGMRNRLVYIQYMPNKRHARFGVKKFELCDGNGYVVHVELYAGKDFSIHHEDGQAHAVVLSLMEKSGLLNN